jgi:hypothetical protein
LAAIPSSNAGSVASLVNKDGGSGGIGIPRRGCERYNRRRAGGGGTIEDWAIRHEDVIFKEKIGNGSFGTVWKADYFGTVGEAILFYEIRVKKLRGISSVEFSILALILNHLT